MHNYKLRNGPPTAVILHAGDQNNKNETNIFIKTARIKDSFSMKSSSNCIAQNLGWWVTTIYYTISHKYIVEGRIEMED